MTNEDAPARPAGLRAYVKFSARLARAVCARVAAGESQVAICADADMPSRNALARWARERPAFGRILARARVLGDRTGTGASTFCPVTAAEIATRVAEGESVRAISRDPAMPAASTILLWRRSNREFAEQMRVAREVQAELLCDQAWELAQAATPATTALTSMQLAQLRWMTGKLSPKAYGPMKALDPPVAPRTQTILFRHFKVETHPQTGQQRVVGYTPDPASMTPVPDAEGEWTLLPKVADLSPEAVAERAADIARMRDYDQD